MIPEGKNPGDLCDVCKRPYTREEGYDYTFEGCSEFCASESDVGIQAFLALQPGEYGIWPCPDCGCSVEGEYEPGGVCSNCARTRKHNRIRQLLEEAIPYMPPEWGEKAREALKR